MKIRSQVGMVLNLDKCIGCHTCSVTCKNVWTSREGAEYAWFNNVETKPGTGFPTDWENQEKWKGGWIRKINGKLVPRMGNKALLLGKIFANPHLPGIDDYYEPFDFDYQTLHNTPADSKAQPIARPRSLITGQRMDKIIPNPLLPECRADTRNAVIEHGADMGIAFDGDFDRCFLFDEKGQFIEGYYIVGLLAEAFLEKNPGAKIIHDPRLSWNTVDVVTAAGGKPVMSKTGHAFIKERMRHEDAVYGGEMSAHHYFRDFAYCDSGMIPWLLVAELLCLKGQSLGELVRDRMVAYPASGEINSTLAEPAAAIARVEQHFSREALSVDRTDGISMSFVDWRFNLRASNTEPVVRLNVESRGDIPLMEARTRTLLALLNQ